MLHKLCKPLESCMCICAKKCHDMNKIAMFAYLQVVGCIWCACARIFDNVFSLLVSFDFLLFCPLNDVSTIASFSRILCFNLFRSYERRCYFHGIRCINWLVIVIVRATMGHLHRANKRRDCLFTVWPRFVISMQLLTCGCLLACIVWMYGQIGNDSQNK